MNIRKWKVKNHFYRCLTYSLISFSAPLRCLPSVLLSLSRKPTIILKSLFDSINPENLPLRFDSQIITYEINADGGYDLHDCYALRKRRLRAFCGTWTPSGSGATRKGGLMLTHPGVTLHERRTNLQGVELTCVVKHAPPTMIIRKDSEGRIAALEGQKCSIIFCSPRFVQIYFVHNSYCHPLWLIGPRRIDSSRKIQIRIKYDSLKELVKEIDMTRAHFKYCTETSAHFTLPTSGNTYLHTSLLYFYCFDQILITSFQRISKFFFSYMFHYCKFEFSYWSETWGQFRFRHPPWPRQDNVTAPELQVQLQRDWGRPVRL